MLSGHLWTILPRLRHALRPTPMPADEPWSTQVDDPALGPVRLTGRLRRTGSDTVVVLVHGLGGCSESHYMPGMARALEEAGLDCLRLNLRGADLSGEDFYHGGLTADLAAAAASSGLAPYRHLLALGFSLGGHVVLRYATEAGDDRLRGAVAVCAPLDLQSSQQAIDRPGRWLYRRYVLGNLRRIYRAVAARRSLPVPLPEVMAAATIREWDRLTVVPRWGFASPEQYYAEASVGPRLDRLRVPALLVVSRRDPMVPPAGIEPALVDGRAGSLDARWVEGGGHVTFPADLDLGEAGAMGLQGQVTGWLGARAAEGSALGPEVA